MVVNASATGAPAFIGSGEAANIAPVIITPEQSDVVGNAHSLFVILLDFLVEGPILRDFLQVGIHLVGEDFALV
jgi:hypothetical protein